MLQVSTTPSGVRLAGLAEDRSLVLIHCKSAGGGTQVIPAVVEGFVSKSFFLPGYAVADVVKFILEKSDRESPPKGYPQERSGYADPDEYEFPIDTHEHVRAAISYFHKHPFKSPGAKRSAAKRIVNAARKHGIEVDEDSDVARAAGAK